ncbi:MAG: MoxR family ATPase [Candidatus Lokiarchaeota archaeon]|nr:MoxR family ATPase [Candidatus Lokiarchaeota archaeon]
MNNDEKNLRIKTWKILNILQANQLFLHSKNLEIRYLDDKEKVIKKQLPEIITLCILNAIVPNSAMILIGGHGGGKSTICKLLGRMFTGVSLKDIEQAIVRGHPQLTEEKLVGTLKLGKLMKEGKEEIVWRSFITSFWKIIDELNRLSPYAQDILLSLLAEGSVKYYDAIISIEKYCLFATLNPQDVGTFDLSTPFLDRFGISVQFSMPNSSDLQLILAGKDERYSGMDEIVQVPFIMNIEELMEVWFHVNNMKFSSDVNEYIHAIVREYTLCDRVDKGNSEHLKPSKGICSISQCHFNTANSICNKIDSILSVRVAKDLLRYSKALAWFLGLEKVDINIVNVIAPFVISHRVAYIFRELDKAPFWGDKYEFTRFLLKSIQKRFVNRKVCYSILERYRQGTPEEGDLTELKKHEKNDLIVKYDLLPIIERLNNKKYFKIAQKILDATKTGKIEIISQIKKDLLEGIEIPQRPYLLNWCNRELYKQTVSNFVVHYKNWKELWADVALEFPDLDTPLKKIFEKRQTRQIRTPDLLIEVNVTGTNDDSLVNIQISGGAEAIRLRTVLDKLKYLNSHAIMHFSKD